MILIINTLEDKQVLHTTEERLKFSGIEYELIHTADLNLNPCIGCNYCWLKHPGICTIKDDYEMILKKIIHADQMWIAADTHFGFISYKGKNIVDRIMPLVTMNLHMKDGQMRHIIRYDKMPDLTTTKPGSLQGRRCSLNGCSSFFRLCLRHLRSVRTKRSPRAGDAQSHLHINHMSKRER